eukprot:scaffold2119_cov264-Pinguiococcus_pyrenoidosus.AAC.24
MTFEPDAPLLRPRRCSRWAKARSMWRPSCSPTTNSGASPSPSSPLASLSRPMSKLTNFAIRRTLAEAETAFANAKDASTNTVRELHSTAARVFRS